MPETTIFTMDINSLTQQANVIKEVLLLSLEKDEILEPGRAKELCERYAVVLEKPGLFGKLFRKIENADPKEHYYRVVKVV